MQRYKLGCLPKEQASPQAKAKTLYFSKYLLPTAPPPPPNKVFWEYKIDPSKIGMYGNEVCGDCTWAAVAHFLMLATAHTGAMFTPDPGEVIKAYSAMTGYDPSQTDANGNNPTDTGCAIPDVLNYMQTTGLQGYKILGWAEVDPTNGLHCQQGVWIFGAMDEGVNLPANAQDQFNAGQNWEAVDDDGGIEGGHCILRTGFGADGVNYQSWGKGDVKAGSAWSAKYTNQDFVILTPAWLKDGASPSHLNMDALVADLKLIAA